MSASMPSNGFEQPPTLWIPVRQLLLHNQFLKYSLGMRKNVTVTVRPPIPLFVSHRWHSLRNPDPDGFQHHLVLRFLIEAICLSRALCERFFTVGRHPVVNSALRHELSRGRDRGADDHPEWQRASAAHCEFDTALLLNGWWLTHHPYLRLEPLELAEIASCLERVGIWYDFTCMPQRPFESNRQRSDFDWYLRNLNELIAASHVLIAWDKTSLNRAWCLYEAVVAHCKQHVSVDITPNAAHKMTVTVQGGGIPLREFASETPIVLNLEQGDGEHLVVQGSRDLAANVEQRASLLLGSSEGDIEDFFRSNEIQTSHEEDLRVVARLLSSYRPLNRSCT